MFRFLGCLRDCLLREKSLEVLSLYDAIVACSQNVVNHLASCTPLLGKVTYIPIPQEEMRGCDLKDDGVLFNQLGLRKSKYILSAGLIKSGKGIDFLFKAYAKYRMNKLEPLPLILVGVIKDEKLARLAKTLPGVFLIGEIDRFRLLGLIKNAGLNINVSLSEGMPRISLEALSLQSKVILPLGIPEFEEHCKDWVAVSYANAEALAAQFDWALSQVISPKYPINDHYLNNVGRYYAHTFKNTLQGK